MGALVGAPPPGTLICAPTQKPSRSGSGVFIFIGAWLPLYRRGWLNHCMCVLSCSVMSISLSPPGSSVHDIFQARILEWGAISFSRGSSRPRDRTCISCISLSSRRILDHCATWKAGLYHWPLVIALNLQSSPLPPSQGTGCSLNLTKMWSFWEKLFWKPKPWCSEFDLSQSYPHYGLYFFDAEHFHITVPFYLHDRPISRGWYDNLSYRWD